MAILHTSFAGPAQVVSHVEQDIDRYITECTDGNFDPILLHDDRFEVFYHCSNLRAGLFAWYDFPKDAEVLEIEAGFGALTKIFTERALHVTATERSMFRARAMTKRFAHVKNLDIYAGDLPELHIVRKFDVIILTDVLPTVATDTTDLMAYSEYLAMVRSYLKLDGKLLIAMDNRMGLKFFAGACHPFSKETFGELGGLSTSGHLFSHKELEKIVADAGFSKVKFFYPLPDFRFPQVVYSDDFLPEKNLNEMFFPYDPTGDTRVFREENLYEDILEHGVFPFFANSFLVECTRDGELSPVERAIIVSDRKRENSVAEAITKEGEVHSQAIFNEGTEFVREVAQNLDTLRERGLEVVSSHFEDARLIFPYQKRQTLSEYLRTLKKGDKEKVIAIFDRLWAAILQSSPPVKDEENALANETVLADDWGVILRRAYILMVPDNIFYEEGHFIFYRQEFVRENYPARYPLFRAIYYSYSDLEDVVSLEELKTWYGLDAIWENLLAEEEVFIASIRNYDVYHQFYAWADIDDNRMLKNRQVLRIMGGK